MKKLFGRLEYWFDRAAEKQARRSAQRLGRRHLLATLGQIMVGAAALPLLPFDRSGSANAAESPASAPESPKGKFTNTKDDQACDYWRYCALSGSLCTCCGGSVSSCPPGTEVSKVTWIGTCQNPDNKQQYLVSYNDCCGQSMCAQCHCSNHQGDRPGYRLGLHSGVNWCMANMSNGANAYHCTVAALVGLAENG